MGRARMEPDQRRRRVVLYLPPDVVTRLEEIPKGQRGRWVTELLRAALAVEPIAQAGRRER
jgi:hypothetical protein